MERLNTSYGIMSWLISKELPICYQNLGNLLNHIFFMFNIFSKQYLKIKCMDYTEAYKYVNL